MIHRGLFQLLPFCDSVKEPYLLPGLSLTRQSYPHNGEEFVHEAFTLDWILDQSLSPQRDGSARVVGTILLPRAWLLF